VQVQQRQLDNGQEQEITFREAIWLSTYWL